MHRVEGKERFLETQLNKPEATLPDLKGIPDSYNTVLKTFGFG